MDEEGVWIHPVLENAKGKDATDLIAKEHNREWQYNAMCGIVLSFSKIKEG